MLRRVAAVLGLLVLAGLLAWWGIWLCRPELVVYLDPQLDGLVDPEAFASRFREAGVAHLRLRPYAGDVTLDSRGRTVCIAVVARPGRNPLLTPADLQAGLTGPGYTEDRLAGLYPEDLERFLVKHRRRFIQAGLQQDWGQVRRYLYTNTAVHEAWHAAAQSHSHNPRRVDSVMYWDAAGNVLQLGSRSLGFTDGHRERLRRMFRPRWPWEACF
ncbi:MAG: hypothetical protein AB1758_15025 [Candidatus Eremiobacterota bacterium]